MTLTQILKALVTCILVISFVLLTISAYQRHRTISALAELSDATSAIATRLTVDELAYVDGSGRLYMYTIDSAKLDDLSTFTLEIGGDNFSYQMSVSYLGGGGGTYGLTPPEGRTRCSLAVGCAIYEDNRFLPAKLSVIAWRA
jgi:hypothetical protein